MPQQGNQQLLSLDISWNGFSWDGAEALGKALVENNTLTELNVSNNRLADKGIYKLIKGLTLNESLQVLKVLETALYRIFLLPHKTNYGLALDNSKEIDKYNSLDSLK